MFKAQIYRGIGDLNLLLPVPFNPAFYSLPKWFLPPAILVQDVMPCCKISLSLEIQFPALPSPTCTPSAPTPYSPGLPPLPTPPNPPFPLSFTCIHFLAKVESTDEPTSVRGAGMVQ